MQSENYDIDAVHTIFRSGYRKLTIPVFLLCWLVFVTGNIRIAAQPLHSRIDSFRTGDIKVTKDMPDSIHRKRSVIVCFYALPNGNTTDQTMGKHLLPGDDWHFDIQHIRAQTIFLRKELQLTQLVVVYMENIYKSWPAWKQQHSDFKTRLPQLVDSITATIPGYKKSIYLNGHSGGGSFIFGYLAGIKNIPRKVKRISFIDSNYGYDSSYFPALNQWLQTVKGAALNVFAYNDSIALYKGKPVVSATGGTWYRSHLMLRHFQQSAEFTHTSTDSLDIYQRKDRRVQFYLKLNTDRGIYHTQQVELNGFIHSILCGTPLDSKRYMYYGKRAYQEYVE